MLAAPLVAALAFTGPAPSKAASSRVCMSAESRRAMIARTAAAVGAVVSVVDQAQAKSGEFAKFNFLGNSLSKDTVVQSSPFEVDTNIGKDPASFLAAKEKYDSFATKVKEGETRLTVEVRAADRRRRMGPRLMRRPRGLAQVPKYINKESWALGRGQMRSMMGVMRQGMVQRNNSMDAAKVVKANSLYKKFMRDVENLDYAMEQKDKEAALEASATAASSLKAWKEYTGKA